MMMKQAALLGFGIVVLSLVHAHDNDSIVIAQSGRRHLLLNDGQQQSSIVSSSNKDGNVPPRSALLDAVAQQQQQHLRGRQQPSHSPLAQVHDLKSGNNLDDLADGVLNETIIAAQYGSLQDNTIYSPTDTVCVEQPGCYRAILFDQNGDGFTGSGLLNVTLDGVQVLNVLPGDVGTDCVSCEVPGTVYYFTEFGDCVADDGSTTAPTTVVDPMASCADLDLAFVTDTQADGYVIVVLESGNFGNVLFSQNSFEPETAYGADESQICIAPGTCTEVYVFDDMGDGFEVGSGFILDVDGVTVLEVVANDAGTPCPDCEGTNVTFWSTEFGSCAESAATSTPAPTVPAPPIDAGNVTEAPDAGITVCMEFVLDIVTDSTPAEYSTIVFDLADLNDNDTIDNPLLSASGAAFDPSTPYTGSLDCLDPINCYAFVFYDDGLDGLGAGGSVVANVDGGVIFNLTAGDVTDFVPLDDGTSGFWLTLFGLCG